MNAAPRLAAQRYTWSVLLRDLPPKARWYTISVIAAGGFTFALLVPRATLTPFTPLVVPLAAMALRYFFANTVFIAGAVALSTNQSPWRIWKTDFASSAPSYLLGAVSAAAVIAVSESSGYWLTLLLTAAPLYMTFKLYRAGKATEARQGAILEAAHDAIIT